MKIGSLCTGILGLDRAVAQHFGADLAWYSEIEPAACSVIEREHPGVPNLGDLKTIDWSTVEPVDILTAGYPCQPFSHAGKRKGTDDPRHLWPYIADAVRVLRPRYVVLENVRGHLSLGFDVVLGSLAEAGFDAEWCVLRASDVGACHQRARVFIVATDADRGRREGRRPSATDATGQGAGPAGRLGWPAGAGQDPADADRIHDDRAGRVGPGGWTEPAVDWGKYGPAIARHEHAFGRPAPHPVDDNGRLSPSLVEWMMGYPEGWVDGLTRTHALKALGNAVVTRQALAALQELCPLTAAPPLAMPVAGVPLLLTPTVEDGGRAGSQEWADRWAAGEKIPTSEQRLRTQVRTLPLLPTPVVNDMGGRKTPAEWDAWCDAMKAKHGNGNGHGPSLAIEAQRVASTPEGQVW